MNNLNRAKELLKEGGNQIDGTRILQGKNNETLYLFRCTVRKKTFRWLFIERDGLLSKPTIISSSERKKIGKHFGKGRGIANAPQKKTMVYHEDPNTRRTSQ